jgi:uncharacterized lipoprotein YbaY
MKVLLPAFLALCAAAFGSGCHHLDLTPPGSSDRVVTGVVTNGTNAPLPADTEVAVRVVDVSRGEAKIDVLGDQTVVNPGRMPVPFRIEFSADDSLLRRGVTLEARVSVAGRLRYTTKLAHPLTLGNVRDSQVVEVALASTP